MNRFPRFAGDGAYPYPVGKVVCVGRNCAEHAKEPGNPVPESPLLFIKPASGVEPGDIELTGTPKGAGKLLAGDQIRMSLGDLVSTCGEVRFSDG